MGGGTMRWKRFITYSYRSHDFDVSLNGNLNSSLYQSCALGSPPFCILINVRCDTILFAYFSCFYTKFTLM